MSHDDTIKVLLLEDDADYHRIVAKQLSREQTHFVIDWAETLADAVEKLQRRTYDIVLSDLGLPDSVGLPTVANIKQHCGQTPILVLTAMDDDDVARDILTAGAQDFLLKGEFAGRAIARAILHTVHRQQAANKTKSLMVELEQSQRLLEDQAQLLRKKNRRLKQLYQTAQEFVDNVSHDFRTPLTVIKDYVSIIREGMVGSVNDEQEKMLDKVSVRADDLNNMVDDLLDVSKLEAGLLGAWRRDVPVAELIQRAESLLQHRAQVKNVELKVECDADLPDVYCDAEKAGRVITNLAVNAIKFAGTPGKVTLRAEADPAGQQVIVSITDNGAGIEKESLEQIFSRFQQLDRHDKSTVKGFGLGLNIAQQLCTLNLGELSVRSKVGEGSTFSFTIPIADPTEVFRRWLNVRDADHGSLRLIEITVPQDVSEADSNDIDSFLNYLLRQDDLLFRTDTGRWLLVMSVAPSESGTWLRRAEKQFQKINRNRPQGPLPTYQTETHADWSALDGQEAIVADFDAVSLRAKPVVADV